MMMSQYKWLIVMLLVVESASLWSPEDCPATCVCLEMWIDVLRTKLNAVDCKDRDLTTLDVVPKNTQALITGGNKLAIDSLRLHSLSEVQYLDLSNNQLKLHQVDTLQTLFTQLQTLRALDLSNNYLESLQADLFNGLKSLEYLSLSGNSIVYIERNTFESLVKLKTLKLDNNHLRTINSDWISNTSLSMRDLDLSSNNIENIEGGDLLHLKKLERLKLSKNNISSITTDAFEDSEIQELFLDDNFLEKVYNNVFTPLTRLTILSLDNNPIERLDTNTLFDHPNLKQISFSNMRRLYLVDKHAFKNLPQLLRVDLYQNDKLNFVHPEAFQNCTSLEVLHLHTGSLRGLDEAITRSLPALRELSLYNNKLQCNCLATWLRHTNISLIDDNRIVCSGPHAVRMATLFELNDSQLNSECGPIVILQSSPSVSAEFGTDVTLECVSLGSDQILWKRPNEHFTISNTSESISNGALTIRSIQHRHQGLYTCIAKLAVNGQADSATVNVRVIHSQVSLKTIAISKSFIVVQWDRSDGTCFLSYLAARNGSVQEVEVPPGVSQYTLERLHPDTSYTVCLLYHNKLEQTCIAVHMLPESRTDTPKDNSSLNKNTQSIPSSVLIVFIAVAVAIPLLIIVTLVYIKFKRYRHSKISYLRQFNDTDNIKLEKCYNPTTAPLCDHEHA